LVQDLHFAALVPCVEQVVQRRGEVLASDIACLRAKYNYSGGASEDNGR
jgi:hypothetical protein